MSQRVAGRLVTGPLAFLLAGLIDIAAFGWRLLSQRRAASAAAQRRRS